VTADETTGFAFYEKVATDAGRNSAFATAACRAMAFQEGERAKKLENPGMRGPIERTAQRFAALAEKLEAARKQSRA
jgi:hypothetical protein